MWEWSEWLTQLQVSLGAPEELARIVTYGIGAFILVNAGLITALILIWITRKVKSRSPLAVRMFRLMYLLCASVIFFGISGEAGKLQQDLVLEQGREARLGEADTERLRTHARACRRCRELAALATVTSRARARRRRRRSMPGRCTGAGTRGR